MFSNRRGAARAFIFVCVAGCSTACVAESLPDDAGASGDVAAQSQAACELAGGGTPGACSSCAYDAGAGKWTQTCITIECLPVTRECAAPIVSCGACTLGGFPLSFRQRCTRADGSELWQRCTPPRLPPPIDYVPRR